MRFAQLQNGVVISVIDAPTAPDASWKACGNAGPGFVSNDGGVTFAPPVVAIPVWNWYIDKGPFFDRFGAAKMAVLTSTDAGVIAIRADLSERYWVDLARADVISSLAYVGSKILTVTPALQASILNTLPAPSENYALRKTFFGGA